MAHGVRARLIQFRRIRHPSPLNQVVGVFHWHTHTPLALLHQAVEHGAELKVVVETAHDHVAPARQLLREVVRADRVGQGT